MSRVSTINEFKSSIFALPQESLYKRKISRTNKRQSNICFKLKKRGLFAKIPRKFTGKFRMLILIISKKDKNLRLLNIENPHHVPYLKSLHGAPRDDAGHVGRNDLAGGVVDAPGARSAARPRLTQQLKKKFKL